MCCFVCTPFNTHTRAQCVCVFDYLVHNNTHLSLSHTPHVHKLKHTSALLCLLTRLEDLC